MRIVTITIPNKSVDGVIVNNLQLFYPFYTLNINSCCSIYILFQKHTAAMKKIKTLICILIFCQYLFSQISTIIPSSESIASTSVADIHNWSAFNNPATLGYVDKPEVGLLFENRFILSELSTKSVQFALPTPLINTGISFSYFGYSLYHEMIAGIGFARNFSDKFAMGVQFNYYTAFFSASNTYRGVFMPQIGLTVQLSSSFNIGFNTFNPFQANIQTEYVIKRLPSIFSIGTGYFFSTDFVWRTQFDKELSSNYRFATGFEYQMLKQLALKLGAYSSGYLVPCMGLGLKTGAFKIDLNCEIHPLLGLNTLAAIKYKF